ncbi:MAG: zinc-binding alcohol dehydrogenase [Candidatus Bathyarchaeia archaeon]
MPKELVAVAPKQPALREYEEPELGQKQVRIKSQLSAEKHGTMLSLYLGISSFTNKRYDAKTGLFFPEKEGKGWTSFPMRLGNMTVGTVTEVGSNVQKFKVGDRVYGYLPIRETHTVNEEAVSIAPVELCDKDLVCVDPAVVALMAVREGHVRVGDAVAVFGLGAIGLMAVQLAKISGALKIIGIEPFEKRRTLAETYGADLTLNPFEVDVGQKIKEITNGKGVDISLETSGSYRALHEAIRSTSFGGTIVPVSWYHGEAKGLNLGEEWHFNRQIMVSGARVESEPYRDYPLWDKGRIYESVLELFKRRRLTSQGMLCPLVKFENVVEAYKMIAEKPEETIKLGVVYA